MLLKFCRPPHSIKRTANDVSTPAVMKIIQIANEGEARFLTGESISANGVGATPDIFVPTGTNAPAPGIKLTQGSAVQLAEVRDKYGSVASTVDVILTIHVVETDEVPGGVYIYTTNPILLSISPPFLAMIGGFQLLPTIEQMLVHFVSDDCSSLNETLLQAATYPEGQPLRRWGTMDYADAVYQKKLAQVHSRLIGALSPPMDWMGKQLSLKGALVRVDDTGYDLLPPNHKPTISFYFFSQASYIPLFCCILTET